VRNECGHWTSPGTRGKCGELMAVYKRRNRAGKPIWYFMFSLQGSTRQDRRRISQSGFASKNDATNAEAQRRIEEQQKLELAKRGNAASQVPKTLATLMEEFFRQHVDEKFSAQDHRALPRAGGVPRS
jgi:hypothetical protein